MTYKEELEKVAIRQEFIRKNAAWFFTYGNRINADDMTQLHLEGKKADETGINVV